MINLLPTQYKEELNQEKKLKLILILEIVFLFFLISLILISFSIKLYIQSQAEMVMVLKNLEEKTLETLEISEIREKINFVNENLPKINSFYKEQIGLVETLEKLFQKIPPEVSINSISWNKNILQLSLSGFSPNREILLRFKKGLEECENFNQVDLPLKYLVEPTDIDFNITFKIKK